MVFAFDKVRLSETENTHIHVGYCGGILADGSRPKLLLEDERQTPGARNIIYCVAVSDFIVHTVHFLRVVDPISSTIFCSFYYCSRAYVMYIHRYYILLCIVCLFNVQHSIKIRSVRVLFKIFIFICCMWTDTQNKYDNGHKVMDQMISVTIDRNTVETSLHSKKKRTNQAFCLFNFFLFYFYLQLIRQLSELSDEDECRRCSAVKSELNSFFSVWFSLEIYLTLRIYIYYSLIHNNNNINLILDLDLDGR